MDPLSVSSEVSAFHRATLGEAPFAVGGAVLSRPIACSGDALWVPHDGTLRRHPLAAALVRDVETQHARRDAFDGPVEGEAFDARADSRCR